ncbi:FliA/WhiG family RNA polymerase sigma factor [Seohaeicola saemankumensis]|uniref:sigma-70 family RNA polymerase sigma factor n=1 Tax=Seohaeicola TaxID=481178 RepID=UPI0035CFD471
MLRAQYPEQRPAPHDLIASQMEQVRKIAYYFHSRVRGAVEVEDLIQAGYVGLVDAAQKYERKEGASFAAYAGIKIRGAIADHLRRSSNLCRTTIANRQRVNRATLALERRLQRQPTSVEIAEELGMSVNEYEHWRQAFQANTLQTIEEVHDEFSVWFLSSAGNPEEEINKVELRAALRQALESLSEREALVIQLYYVEELNVYEITEILGVTTGRVSQIKKAAIGNLRRRLAELTGEPED